MLHTLANRTHTYLALLSALAIGIILVVSIATLGLTSVGAQVEGQLSVDCAGTDNGVEAECHYGENQTFSVAINASSVPSAGYPAFQVKLRWDSDVLSYGPSDRPEEEILWPSCDVPARRDNTPDDPSVLLGCVSNPPLPSSYTGNLLKLEFMCIAPGTSQLLLVPREGDIQLGSHFVALDQDGGQVIIDPALTGATVTCGDAGLVGDVDCSGAVTAIDAALILQLIAALTATLPCEENADVNGDATVDAIDVTLILQFTAGLLEDLAPS